jgi:hypothetical protein
MRAAASFVVAADFARDPQRGDLASMIHVTETIVAEPEQAVSAMHTSFAKNG